MIINLFCDASIDLNRKVACGGCYITCQDNTNQTFEIGRRMIIQRNATNNSAEILAIWTGVIEALRLRQIYPGAILRLFSDSKISLYGLRDWMKNWIANIREDGTLVSSSGQPVANQQKFIDIFNIIVENNLRIEFYHQRGHVNEGKVSIDKARSSFIKANKCTPEALGLNMPYLCTCNDMVDKMTREAVRIYLSTGQIVPYAELELEYPIEFSIRANMLHQYIRCIDKTTIVSRHDFKGGYNQ